MSKFNSMDCRVKMNPETYLKFDGTDHVVLKNIYSEEGIRIKYDILLILYELVHWKTVGELVAPWPPDDQQKIIAHLETLEEQHIVITTEEEAASLPESGLSEHLGKDIHINIENHHAMLRDNIRLTAYRRAIEQAVTPSTVAMDLGCGIGILSFFAAMAGAQKVYAIERRPDIIALAEGLAQANGLKEKIHFVTGSSSQIEANDFPEKADLLIAEILGNGILEENVLEFTLDARRRFLKPGAQLIPYRLDIFVFAYDSGFHPSRAEEVKALDDLYGLDFSLFGEILCQKATTRLERYNPMLNKTLSEALCMQSLDFRTLESTLFAQKNEFTMLESGQVTGFCAYFKAYLDEKNILTNSPWAPATHWTHLLYHLSAPRTVQKGDKLSVELFYDGALRLRVL